MRPNDQRVQIVANVNNIVMFQSGFILAGPDR